MDYMLSSNVNVYKEHQHLHVQAWQSATEAKLAAGRKLIAALQQNHDSRPSTSILPPDYDHHPQYEADPLVFLPNRPNSTENSMLFNMHGASLERAGDAQPQYPDDVVFYVGKSRQTFHLNAHTLISASAYFKHLLQHSHSPLPLAAANGQASSDRFARPPIVIDCEEVIFEGLLLLMRYGTLEALPPMSAAEIFRLKKEAQFYGIHYMEPPSKSRAAESGDDCSDMSSVRSRSSSPTDSPKSTMNMSPPVAYKGAGRTHEGVRLACCMSRRLAELPDFPPDLADPARLVLVSCLDRDKASIYTCNCITTSGRQAAGSRMQWALNFHHRHAFCTSCGQPPKVSPKHFTDMFMAAAAYYSSSGQTEPVEPNCAWWVSSDSTCMLRFVSSAGDGADGCGCSAGGARAGKEVRPTIWAANCFYSHAFCTSCGQAAKGPVLLSLLLAVRYGGTNIKVSKCARS